VSRYHGPHGPSRFKQLGEWRRLSPAQRAEVLPCPECGATGERWEDSDGNLRCDDCWAIVAADESEAA
jgi:hypothetical protein